MARKVSWLSLTPKNIGVYKHDVHVPRSRWMCLNCWAAFKRLSDYVTHDCAEERQQRRDMLAAAKLPRHVLGGDKQT